MNRDVKEPGAQNPESILIFTDGACLGNPGPGGWAAILWSGRDDSKAENRNGMITEIGGHAKATTNNRMEMTAALEALRALSKDSSRISKSVRIFTDSKYLIDGATKWARAWKKRGWKTATGEAVKNQEIWEALLEECANFSALRWSYVPGHSGIPGNERCDEIAVAFAEGGEPELYRGDESDYQISLDEGLANLDAGSSRGGSKSGSKIGAKAASKTNEGTTKQDAYYLSHIGGKLYRDKTWAQCEARVKGTRGVKYKKVKSTLEESELLKQWGVQPEKKPETKPEE